MNTKLAAVTALVVISSILIAGCTSQQQTNQSSVLNNGIEVTVKALQSPSKIGTEAPRIGYKWVVFNATVKNVNAPNRAITRNYLSLQDTQGRNYNMSGLSDTLGPFNWSSHSQPGETLGGIVVFEVPQNTTFKSLTYFDGTAKIITAL